ncbi:MAG: HAMP domain-containing sensor histidine kinase [Planctomycetia bacterium]|nr:HAMP domain-containing sensor histidine kinase [Planctomycetia bacterium]
MNNNKNWEVERQELLAKISQLENRLEQVQQLTAVGELASTTTHEFNNILTTVINYAQMGLRHKDDPTREKAFTKILDASNRAAKISRTVLGLARNRKPGFEPINLVQLTEDVLLLLEREMNKYRIQVEKEFQIVPEIMGNGNQIQQILVNLLINARQAMVQGGRLILKIVADQENGTVDLTIRDFGVGIPTEKLPHIFDSFYTTKSGPDESGKGGTGLGLSLCRNIMERHHGKIRVESSVGKGTAFILKFPVSSRCISE